MKNQRPDDGPPIPRETATRMVVTARERYRQARVAGDTEAMRAWERYGELAAYYSER